MSEPQDSCRPVTLPTGETLRVRGAGEMDAAGVAALGEIVDVARRMMPEPDGGAPELYARVDAVRARLGLSARDVAHQAVVSHAMLSRLANGRMPNAMDLSLLELWLRENEDV
jgi:hypothetical protein